MNAKEKANELGNKFYQGSVFDYDKKGHLGEIIKAKERTKICVKEIITALNKLPSKDLSDLQFWGEVECEIDLL